MKIMFSLLFSLKLYLFYLENNDSEKLIFKVKGNTRFILPFIKNLNFIDYLFILAIWLFQEFNLFDS